MVFFNDHICDDRHNSRSQQQLKHEVVKCLEVDFAESLGLDGGWLIATEVYDALFQISLVTWNACVESTSERLLNGLEPCDESSLLSSSFK